MRISRHVKLEGKEDLLANCWIPELEAEYRTSSVRRRYGQVVVGLLRGYVRGWWNLIVRLRSKDQVESMVWEQFSDLFR